MQAFHVSVFILTLQFMSAAGLQSCSEIFNRIKSPRPGELEATISLRLNKSNLNLFNHWEIEIKFPLEVDLHVSQVYVSGESGTIYLPGRGARSNSRPLKEFKNPSIRTQDKRIYTLRENWDSNVINAADILVFTVYMNIRYTNYYIEVVGVKLNNNNMCSGGMDCGASSDSNLLVAHGVATKPEDWPWLAAIFKSSRSSRIFVCGGTLVTARHVLTAAHCVKTSGVITLRPDQIVVYLGKHKLFTDGQQETGLQASGVQKTEVHEDWGRRKNGKSDGDIAVIFLMREIEYTYFVRPICLSLTPDPISAGTLGTVVGWGTDEHGEIGVEARAVKLPVVDGEVCRSSDTRFINLTSERTFCAGNRDGSGPCTGDSGGGFYTSYKLPGDITRFHLSGIVSRALRIHDAPNLCDFSHYSIYTEISAYGLWLRDTIGFNGTGTPLHIPQSGTTIPQIAPQQKPTYNNNIPVTQVGLIQDSSSPPQEVSQLTNSDGFFRRSNRPDKNFVTSTHAPQGGRKK